MGIRNPEKYVSRKRFAEGLRNIADSIEKGNPLDYCTMSQLTVKYERKADLEAALSKKFGEPVVFDDDEPVTT